MGTWAHGQKASRCHAVPLHLNVLDLGDAPSERELDAHRQAGGVGEHATPVSLEPQSIWKSSWTDRTFISWTPLLIDQCRPHGNPGEF